MRSYMSYMFVVCVENHVAAELAIPVMVFLCSSGVVTLHPVLVLGLATPQHLPENHSFPMCGFQACDVPDI